MEWPHLIDNSLKAHHLYRRDRDYVVQPNGEVVIVDEFTGRLMIGRQWSDGLHQAVEAKERVKVKEENQTLATITLQNFFKLYKKLAGMTGTAMTEANEFYKVYHLDVIAIPTNQSLVRVNYPDVIFRFEREKMEAILDEIKEVNASGRPILVGTTSIEKSEELAGMLKSYGHPAPGLERQVSRARGRDRRPGRPPRRRHDRDQHGRPRHRHHPGRQPGIHGLGRPQAAGRRGWPATLLHPARCAQGGLGRGGRPLRAHDEGRGPRSRRASGGLHIIGTERHESRRIDNQLRGRAGRQGDPGSSRFFLSLEDDLMRKFAGEWVSAVLTRLGMQEGEAIESRMVSRRIEGAQKKVEERNFDIRKNLLEYDEVMDEQRKRVYSFRQSLLEGAPPKEMIVEMIDSQIEDAARRFLTDDYGAASFAEWVGQRLGVELTARDVKGASFEDAEEIARTRAERQLRETIRQAMEENLPADADPSEWTWQALANWANARFELNLKEKDLRKYAVTDGDELRVRPRRPRGIPERESRRVTPEDRPVAGPRIPPARLGAPLAQRLGPSQVRPGDRSGDLGRPRPGRDRSPDPEPSATNLYTQKEAELPARIALMKYLGERSQNQTPRYDREGLAAWASSRYHAVIDAEELRPLLRSEIEAILIDLAQQHYQGARLAQELEAKLAAVRLARLARQTETRRRTTPATRPLTIPEALADLAAWAHQSLGLEIGADALASMPATQIRRTLFSALDAKLPPRNARDGESRPAPDPRFELDGTPPGHGPSPQLDRAAGLRPDRSQGRVQAGRHEDLRRDVEWDRRPHHRPDLPRRTVRSRVSPSPGLDVAARPRQTIHHQAESALAAAPAAGRRPRATRRRHRRQRTLHREETRTGPQPWKKGRSKRRLPVRIR